MEHSVVFAGFGGQGLLFAGQVLARAAIRQGLEVFWIPSYGPEMRGGTASCTVILSEEPIGSPTVDAFEAAVVMNPPSLRKFAPHLVPGGLLVRNASLTGADQVGRADLVELALPCAELAAQSGDDKLVSIVALGGLVSATGWVGAPAVRATLAEMTARNRPKMTADLAAFEAGFEAAHHRS